MKVLTIMYKSGLPLERVRELFRRRVRKYARIDALREKLYVRDPATGEVGGVYLFMSDAGLAKFRQSGFEKNIADTYRVTSPMEIRVLDVVMALRDESAPASEAAARCNEDLLRRVIDVINNGDTDALDSLFASDYAEHQSDIKPPSLDGLKAFIRRARAAFPDLRLTVEEVAVTQDRVWARSTAEGTHRGQFLGIRPTGNGFRITRFDACRIDDGKIVEHWAVIDRLSLVQQLR